VTTTQGQKVKGERYKVVYRICSKTLYISAVDGNMNLKLGSNNINIGVNASDTLSRSTGQKPEVEIW